MAEITHAIIPTTFKIIKTFLRLYLMTEAANEAPIKIPIGPNL